MSVAESLVRTNNFQEAFHGTIMLYCGDSRRVAHPNVWRFVGKIIGSFQLQSVLVDDLLTYLPMCVWLSEALQKIEHEFSAKMMEAATGTDLRFPRHPEWIVQDKQINDAYQKLMTLPANNHPHYEYYRQENIRKFLQRAKHFVNVDEEGLFQHLTTGTHFNFHSL